jgi:hypothetical protein
MARRLHDRQEEEKAEIALGINVDIQGFISSHAGVNQGRGQTDHHEAHNTPALRLSAFLLRSLLATRGLIVTHLVIRCPAMRT